MQKDWKQIVGSQFVKVPLAVLVFLNMSADLLLQLGLVLSMKAVRNGSQTGYEVTVSKNFKLYYLIYTHLNLTLLQLYLVAGHLTLLILPMVSFDDYKSFGCSLIIVSFLLSFHTFLN